MGKQADSTAVAAAADVAYYGEAPPDDYAAARCRLDLFAPPGATGYPVLVFFHGGALREFSRDTVLGIVEPLTRRGVGVVAADYRLSPRAACPAYIADAAAAVAWTLEHVGKYGADPRRIFVGGHSAGGYLAAMVALDPSYLAARGRAADELAGAVPISGSMLTPETIRRERGQSLTAMVADEFAPLSFLRAQASPMLLIAADHDAPARAEENRLMAALLRAAGHGDVSVMIVADRDHGKIFGRMTEPGDPVMEAALKFITSRGARSA